MKAQIKRDGSIREVAQVTIHIKETQYIITETNEGTLEIMKIDFNDSNMVVLPRVSNVINIK
jgi:hypothetical protein